MRKSEKVFCPLTSDWGWCGVCGLCLDGVCSLKVIAKCLKESTKL